MGMSHFLGTFSGLLPDFWVPSWAIPGFLGIISWLFSDFCVSFLPAKSDFFKDIPDFLVLILIFY